MGRRIIILDDDREFNTLLTDVFSQADYKVEPFSDPRAALAAVAKGGIDVMVSDYKMPNMTGMEVMKEAHTHLPHLPFIVVSGYLDNDTIRTLIREGVGGIFLKPLNIFALLKKTNELIEKGEAERAAEAEEKEAAANSLPFAFTAFAGKAPRALDFANKLHNLRNVRSNLIVVGEDGSPFEQICRDLVGFSAPGTDALILADSEVLGSALSFSRALKSAQEQGVERVTIGVTHTEALTVTEKAPLYGAARKEGVFAGVTVPLRFVFCVRKDLDSLYDSGTIEDDLYVFLGTSQEVQVPRLRDCADDIPLLAARLLKQLCVERKIDPPVRLEDAGKAFLRGQPFPGNLDELRLTLVAALAMADKGVIKTDDLKFAYEFKSTRQSGFKVQPLKDYLAGERTDYVVAVGLLCGGSADKAAEVMQLDRRVTQMLLTEVERPA